MSAQKRRLGPASICVRSGAVTPQVPSLGTSPYFAAWLTTVLSYFELSLVGYCGNAMGLFQRAKSIVPSHRRMHRSFLDPSSLPEEAVTLGHCFTWRPLLSMDSSRACVISGEKKSLLRLPPNEQGTSFEVQHAR